MPRKTVASWADFLKLPTNDHIEYPLWISFREHPAQSVFPMHRHAWGEFIYAFHGVMQVSIDQVDYITPPPYGIWLPPNTAHSGLNRTDVSHGTLYVHESLCHRLPQEPGILLSNPLVTALLLHLKQHPLAENSEEHLRLLQVLLDQLEQATLIRSYLPHSQHPILQPILDLLHQDIANNAALSELAQQFNTTERTLARYCQKELGMTLNEWRQRLKVIKAMSMLHEGKKVESIALDLGYSNASAFINMFKRWMLYTPDQFRKLHHIT